MDLKDLAEQVLIPILWVFGSILVVRLYEMRRMRLLAAPYVSKLIKDELTEIISKSDGDLSILFMVDALAKKETLSAGDSQLLKDLLHRVRESQYTDRLQEIKVSITAKVMESIYHDLEDLLNQRDTVTIVDILNVIRGNPQQKTYFMTPEQYQKLRTLTSRHLT